MRVASAQIDATWNAGKSGQELREKRDGLIEKNAALRSAECDDANAANIAINKESQDW